MARLNDIIGMLRSDKQLLKSRFKVKKIGVFGSFASGKETGKSDIDILVDFSSSANYFDLVELGDYLEKKCKRKIDIVTSTSIHPMLKKKILSDAVIA